MLRSTPRRAGRDPVLQQRRRPADRQERHVPQRAGHRPAQGLQLVLQLADRRQRRLHLGQQPGRAVRELRDPLGGRHHQHDLGGYVVQARTVTAADKGFVFLNSMLTHGPGPGPLAGDVPTGAAAATYLARSPGGTASFDNIAYVNCQMDNHVIPIGWAYNINGQPPPNPAVPTAGQRLARVRQHRPHRRAAEPGRAGRRRPDDQRRRRGRVLQPRPDLRGVRRRGRVEPAAVIRAAPRCAAQRSQRSAASTLVGRVGVEGEAAGLRYTGGDHDDGFTTGAPPLLLRRTTSRTSVTAG